MSSTYRRDLWAFCAAAARRLCSISWKGTVSPQHHLLESAGGNAEHFPEFHAIKTVNRSSLAYSSSHCNHIIFMQRKLPARTVSPSYCLTLVGCFLPFLQHGSLQLFSLEEKYFVDVQLKQHSATSNGSQHFRKTV